MALTPKLEIKQSQSLLLTPQLRQAISLLQMNNLELNELIEQELQSNPLLERESDHLSSIDDDFQPTINDVNSASPSQDETSISSDISYQDSFDDFGSDTEGYSNYENADWSDYNQSKIKRSDDDAFDYFEQKLAQEKSLYTIIEEQISLHFSNHIDRLLAKILSEQLDAAGYFRGNIDDICHQLKTSSQRLQKILKTLKVAFKTRKEYKESLT